MEWYRKIERTLRNAGSVLMVCSASVFLITLLIVSIPRYGYSQETAIRTSSVPTNIIQQEAGWANLTAMGAMIVYTLGLTFRVLPKMNESRDTNDQRHREEVKALVDSKDVAEKAHREEISGMMKAHREDISRMMSDWSSTIAKSSEALTELRTSCAAANVVLRRDQGGK